MEPLHRKTPAYDPKIGRDCQFCKNHDPHFCERKPVDRRVQETMGDTAAAHLTEDGYVKHRLAELDRMQATLTAA
jgi:hypothetical protein